MTETTSLNIHSAWLWVVLSLGVVLSSCNTKNSDRVYPIFTNQLTPAFVEVSFPKGSDLPTTKLHIDNEKLRIFNSNYLPYGSKVDSVYLKMAISSELNVDLLNTTTGKVIQGWRASDTSKIDLTGGKLIITITKKDTPTVTYDLRLLTYGYDPSKLTWKLQNEQLPEPSAEGHVHTHGGNTYWVSDNGAGALALYKVLSTTPLNLAKVSAAQLPAQLMPKSLFGGTNGTTWGVTREGLLYSTTDMLTWQLASLGTYRVNMIISEQSSTTGTPVLAMIGYDSVAPSTYFTITFDGKSATKVEALPSSFPVNGAYVYTHLVEGDPHSNIVGGMTKNGTPATKSFFTSDGIHWGETPYTLSGGVAKLPVSGGLYLRADNNRSVYLVGGLLTSGKPANSVQVSHDRGISWTEVAKEQSPGEDFKPRYGTAGIISLNAGQPDMILLGGRVNGTPSREIWRAWLNQEGGIINSY